MTTNCQCPIEDTWRLYTPDYCTSNGSTLLLFVTILETFFKFQCDLLDPCNRIKDTKEFEDAYDFIVVGGGTAGSVVAGRLSENPDWKVLVLEAGYDEPPVSSIPGYYGILLSTDTDWQTRIEVDTEHACKTTRCGTWPGGRVLGGSSVVNGLNYVRGQRKDYDNWAALGAEGWSWDEVKQYFFKLEDNQLVKEGVLSGEYHGVGGPVTIDRFPIAGVWFDDALTAAQEAGFDFTNDYSGEKEQGFFIPLATTRNGTRMSSARSYLRPASKRENLQVSLNSHVTRIIFDEDGARAVGVQFVKNDRLYTVYSTREVILSAGTLRSPQILMLSGVGPAETLEKYNIPLVKDLQSVGKTLLYHVGVKIRFKTNRLDTNVLNWKTINEYKLGRTGPLASNANLAVLGARLRTRYARDERADIELITGSPSPICSATGAVGELVDQANPNATTYLTIQALHNLPQSSGFLTLRSSDPLDAPLIYPQFFTVQDDIDVLVEAARFSLRWMNSTTLKEKHDIEIDLINKECIKYAEDLYSYEYLECHIRHYTDEQNHQFTTCKMGDPNDENTVVTPELKVLGVEGLRVIDGSIIPEQPTGNPMATILMIGEKGADLIKRTHGFYV